MVWTTRFFFFSRSFWLAVGRNRCVVWMGFFPSYRPIGPQTRNAMVLNVRAADAAADGNENLHSMKQMCVLTTLNEIYLGFGGNDQRNSFMMDLITRELVKRQQNCRFVCRLDVCVCTRCVYMDVRIYGCVLWFAFDS